VIDLAVSTHPDGDRINSLRTVIVGGLIVGWWHARFVREMRSSRLHCLDTVMFNLCTLQLHHGATRPDR
jgi:hypothetical protein